MNKEHDKWEFFHDTAYFNMYAVRPKFENRWGYCFHLTDAEEAAGLVDLLNQLSHTRSDKELRKIWNEET